MLHSKNLDDQTYEEIRDYMLGKLPWISPQWTDHNAHDPGITLLELMAWYKEMQQYHLNAAAQSMQKTLLKLAGVTLQPPRPATCYVELPPGDYEKRPRSRLATAEDMILELKQTARGSNRLLAAWLEGQTGQLDITELITQEALSVTPFSHEGAPAKLNLSLETQEQDSLRLWFELDDSYPVKRNPFSEEEDCPREILWSFGDFGPVTVRRDETHALSRSGYITFPLPPNAASNEAGGRQYLLTAQLKNPGCEETVRIRAIGVNRYEAIQQETRAFVSRFTVEGGGAVSLSLPDAISPEAALFVFQVQGEALSQLAWEKSVTQEDTQVRVTLAETQEPQEVLIASLAALHWQEMVFPSDGLPGMRLQLSLGERQVLTDELLLICDTIAPDGSKCPMLWRCTDDLRSCDPGERVFRYDQSSQCITFGDGEHGAIVPKGENAVLLAQLLLSHCQGGNLPPGEVFFCADGLPARNTQAYGGAEAQTVEEAARTFRSRLEQPQKCMSGPDYERAAKSTPGLRVAAARAMADYDPDEPAGKSNIPCVTVAVLPYSAAERPLPDARFLAAVNRHIQAKRPICTKVKVIAPTYLPVALRVTIKGSAAAPEQLRQVLRDYFTLSDKRPIGAPVVKNDLLKSILATESVYSVEQLELHAMAANCPVTAAGDVSLPGYAVAYPERIEIQTGR